ncbi:MAG: MarR family winged helix-turn-helix transcriptional regulator [Candidatus Dormibacterales bacterium]
MDILPDVEDSMLRGFTSRSTAHQLWALIVEAKRVFHDRAATAAAASGLSPASAWALIRLDPGMPISQRELAERLHCAPSTVVDPTDKLEERGLVVRKVHPSDRRVNILVVTEEGRRMRERLMTSLLDAPQALKNLSATDQATFRDAMLAVVGQPDKPEKLDKRVEPAGAASVRAAAPDKRAGEPGLRRQPSAARS